MIETGGFKKMFISKAIIFQRVEWAGGVGGRVGEGGGGAGGGSGAGGGLKIDSSTLKAQRDFSFPKPFQEA